MQGNLNEIDIRSILELIELGQRTGELFVEAYSQPLTPLCAVRDHYRNRDTRPQGQSWFVFFFNGQIIYAASDSDSNLSRLRDYLRRYKAETALDSIKVSAIASTNAPEYGYLWALLENRVLTPAQGRNIIQSMVHETLFDLLSLHQGSFIFEMGPALAPQLTTLEIGSLVTKIMKRVQEWKQFHPHIQSPNQCPVISDPEKLREALPENIFKTLTRWADGQTTILGLARYLNRDVLTVARAIYPYVQQGLVQLSYPANEAGTACKWDLGLGQPAKVPRIVCIDDEVAVRKSVEYILSQHGYEATAISNPLKALSLVFQLKPDLILCDITMPELDGYELCAMLRRSTAFRQTPIVMLTGKDGFIDRVKARMVGSTDYLTKPFGESELLMLVEKYVGRGYPEHPQPERLLEKDIQTELDLDMPDASPSRSAPLI
ncbi:response regulator [Kamptonema formosum]|uniref:response regulator n=1 Tax=Kamptonema formosum TaxID=331992 RepID=UPI000347D0A9|nr:response regulator [Oscillatoria sp. PCC 10802]